MTPEIWRAKKIVDSTLHPGKTLPPHVHLHKANILDTGQPVFLPFRMSCFVISNLIVTAGMLTPGLQVQQPLVPNHNLTDQSPDNGHAPLADNQSIPQRRHQQRQRQQVYSSLDAYNSKVIPFCRLRFLLRSYRPQRNRAPAEAPVTHCEDHPDSTGAICRCCISWRAQRVPDAWGGNTARN